MDTFSYFITFCQRLINALANLVDPILELCEISLYTAIKNIGKFAGPMSYTQQLAKSLEGTEFGETPLLFALLGAGFITYITYAIIKWFLDIIL